MRKLIFGEIYRLLHKKSMYAYFGAVAAGYILFAFVRSGGFNEESIPSDAVELFTFLPAVAGGFLFSAIYTDDLNAKNLITLVGYGLDKIKIVFAKFILALLFVTVCFWLVPLFHCAVYTVLGCAATLSLMAMVYVFSFKFMLMTLAYIVFSSIVAFGLQRATFAMVTYILFAFNIINVMLTSAAKALKLNLGGHLLSGVTDRIIAGMITGGSLIFPLMEYAAYIIIALAFSALAFHKKEMEF